MVVAPDDAAAAPDVCAGSGLMIVNGLLYYPLLGTSIIAPYTFTLSLGACASGDTLVAVGGLGGMLSGAVCGQSLGYGTANGRTFIWTEAGSLAVLHGGVIGTLLVVPNAATGSNCLTGARHFLVTGAAALV